MNENHVILATIELPDGEGTLEIKGEPVPAQHVNDVQLSACHIRHRPGCYLPMLQRQVNVKTVLHCHADCGLRLVLPLGRESSGGVTIGRLKSYFEE